MNWRKVLIVEMYYTLELRGRGFIFGLACLNRDIAGKIKHHCFNMGLMLETCGPHGNILKILPPLIIDENTLFKGLSILDNAFQK